jgi:hypothetical protein
MPIAAHAFFDELAARRPGAGDPGAPPDSLL